MGDSLVVRAEPGVSGGVRALPGRVALPLGVVSVLAALTLVVLGFVFAGSSAAVDLGVRVEQRSLAAPWAQLALVVDWTAEPVGAAVVLVVLVIVFLRKGNRRGALLAVVGTAVTVAVTTGLKPVVGRTINDGFLSFPSGHTATATAFALVVTLAVGRFWLMAVVTVLGAAAMATSQVALNAHYPTDTVGGFCAALAIVPAVAWVVDRVADRWLRF